MKDITYINPDKEHNDMYTLTDIQKEAVSKVCPHCLAGDLHAVPDNESEEIYLWCNQCDLSMDSMGGYTS